MSEDRERAVKLLAGMGIIFIGGMSAAQKAQHEFRIKEIIGLIAAIRRDEEWAKAAREAQEKTYKLTARIAAALHPPKAEWGHTIASTLSYSKLIRDLAASKWVNQDAERMAEYEEEIRRRQTIITNALAALVEGVRK